MATTVVGFDGLRQHLETLPQRVREIDYTPPMREIIKDLEEAHADQFARGITPGGDKLTPLSTVTVKRKGHDRILQDRGDLMQSLSNRTAESIRDIVAEVYSPGLSFGTRDPKSRKHQDGGPNLPQRQHVGTNRGRVRRYVRLIVDHIIGTLSRGPLT